jgi:hypothetical protein
MLIFGGEDGSGNVLDETWSWDGTTWTQLDVMGPPPRVGAALVGP